MAMPRPSGKAQKIAQQVIPGLNRNRPAKSLRTKKIRPYGKDDVEIKIVDINEQLGRDLHPRTKSGFGISN